MPGQNKKRPLIALSLGGGGAKTFAHLGILDALKDEGIKVDFLITCSSASIIGFLFCIGVSSGEIRQEFKKKRKWIWLIKRSIFKRVLKKFIKEKNITDLDQSKIPLSIVTVDLKKGKEVIFDKGDPLPICLGSAAFPGIWQSVKYKNYCLIDGGILNPDPADIARKKVGRKGIVISSTLRMEFIKEKTGSRFNTILKSIYLLQFKYRNKIIKENSNIIISPLDNLKINFADWKETFTGYFSNNKIEKFYKKGYEATIKEMPRIKKIIKFQ
ncbi:MAG: patatin-like phospholipase family protein [Patescibacteria group bacterium]|nr:patatin-like phospholipase family protein [Patescibacteria group bacterium]